MNKNPTDSKKEKTKKDRLEIEDLYSEFKKNKKEFFILSNEITDYLPLIKTSAINLYLFYASKADNKTGISWWSIENVADELNVSKRTISNWIKELEKVGLIARASRFNQSSISKLLPTKDTLIETNSLERKNKWFKLLNDLGYKNSNCIKINLTDTGYSYYQFNQKYTNNNVSVYRNITIKIKETDAYTAFDEPNIQFYNSENYMTEIASNSSYLKKSSYTKKVDEVIQSTLKDIRKKGIDSFNNNI